MTKVTTRRKPISKKVTISIPDDLFVEIERARRAEHLDRSRWLQNAVGESLGRRRSARAVEAFVESYRADPEEEFDVAVAAKRASAAWAELK